MSSIKGEMFADLLIKEWMTQSPSIESNEHSYSKAIGTYFFFVGRIQCLVYTYAVLGAKIYQWKSKIIHKSYTPDRQTNI